MLVGGSMTAFAASRWFGVLALAAGLVSGCKSKPSEGKGAPAPSGSNVPAPVASGLPTTLADVSNVVNPLREPVYSGPAGAVRGVIRASGDAPPDQRHVLQKIGEDCAPAREMYGKLFREGAGRTLADVLVAVTEYKGYVPEQKSVVQVDASGCAWSGRTFALTFGQRIDVISKDRRPYVPDLMGAQMPAQLVALPGGGGSQLYPQSPGRFVLVDSLHLFTAANVVVLKYATHDVTGLDGRYSIERIPAGKVKLGVMLPATGAVIEREIEIQPSRTVDLDLELPFDLKKFEGQRDAAAGSPGAASAAAPAPAAGSPAPAPSGK